MKISRLVDFFQKMFIKKLKEKDGFTLIEVIVVVTVVALIMVAIISVVVSTFKIQNQTQSNSKVVSGGNAILSELKKNILNSNSNSISCGSDNLSVTFSNNFDGKTTVISCLGGKIASTSGQTVYLTSGDISIVDCGQFVTCYTLPSLETSSVEFKFGVGSSTAGVGITQNFEMNVVVRN